MTQQFFHGANTPHCSLLCCHPSFLWFSFIRGDHSPTATSAPSLRPACPERFPNKFSVSLGYYNHPKFTSFSLFSNTIIPSFLIFLSFSLTHTHNSGGCNLWSGRYSHLSSSYSVRDFFFHFGGGRPLHKVQSFVFRIPTTDLAVRSAISSLLVFLKILAIYCAIFMLRIS
jgi:hypothetical protein